MNKIGGAFGQKSAEEGIGQYKNGADQHHCMIIKAEKLIEKFAYRDKTAARVNSKKDEDKQRREGHDDFFFSRKRLLKNSGMVMALPAAMNICEVAWRPAASLDKFR